MSHYIAAYTNVSNYLIVYSHLCIYTVNGCIVYLLLIIFATLLVV